MAFGIRPRVPQVVSRAVRCWAAALAAGALVAAGWCALGADAASAPPALDVTTSWIGNTFGFGDGSWTQINITDIAVTPDGRVFTNSPWDESGAEASVYQNGKVLRVAGGTHGWGNSGGLAVAVNHRYAYLGVSVSSDGGRVFAPGVTPPKGHTWFGVSRREVDDVSKAATFRLPDVAYDEHSQLAAAFLRINDQLGPPAGSTPDANAPGPDAGGLAASDSTLYVANTAHDRIERYDAETLARLGTWPVRRPGRLALGPDGTVWALTSAGPHEIPRVAHFDAQGNALPDTLTLPADTIATDLTVDSADRVLVADNGPRQQILIFARREGRFELTGTLGEAGGIFGGVPGKPGPLRFDGPSGVGVDAAGNIYVACNGSGSRYGTIANGTGATLASFAPDGTLRWQVEGLLFVDGAWMDPARPDSVYTGNKRFVLDLSKPPGHDWTWVGLLSNRFRYPDDPVFYTDDYPGQPIARSLRGHTFLFLTDMYADHLKIYRFDPAHDGETAIPSGFIAGGAEAVARVPHAPPGGEWLWRDLNGDGGFSADEFTQNVSAPKLAGGWGWWVDEHGDIWRTVDRAIYRLRFGGLDAHGNPVYSYADMVAYTVPAPFTSVRRAIYDAQDDSLYVTGYTRDAPFDPSYWKEAGRVLARYDHWSSGSPVLRYAIALPWQTGATPALTSLALTVEGQYIFVVEPAATVHVFDRASGAEVGTFRPGPEVGRTSGWIDVPNAISAHREANGEYLIFVEEDARGKVLVYRWKPHA
ncbi:hypothetical protein [Paraburkholderia phosphatilytica]|uniref:hypothetical protein n=1 Tax=Paraburkholderia phosphatilytica TaxID=2282883 RepID=UPI003B834A64